MNILIYNLNFIIKKRILKKFILLFLLKKVIPFVSKHEYSRSKIASLL